MPNFKNIIGSGFPEYINKQIKKRQSIVSQENRNNNTLQFLTNRNVWVRLSSSVNVGSEGDKVAKENILQGGTLNKSANLRGGFNETYKKGTDDDLGFKPMPGITNVSIGTGGKWQTLMQADIEFICYDLGQLDIMTKLYMSLGYSVFLEWGHSNYFKSEDNTFEPNPNHINFFNYNDKDKLLKASTKQRINTEGNYECMLGTVYNFDWTANNDCSYNCKIQVMGPGGILESLKINNNNNVNFNKTPIIGTGNSIGGSSSDLQEALVSLKNFFLSTGKIISKKGNKINGIQEVTFNDKELFFNIAADVDITFDIDSGRTYKQLLEEIYSSCNYQGPTFDSSNNIVNKNVNIRKGNAHQLISGYSLEDNIKDIDSSLYHGYISSTTIDTEKNFCTYITLGHLFTLIQHIGIFTTGKDTTTKPIVYLDYNPDNTLIKQTQYQASVDPSICLIPRNNLNVIFTKNKVDTVKLLKQFAASSQDKWWEKVINLPENIDKLLSGESTSTSIVPLPEFNGKIFNVLVNLDFAINTLKRLSQSSNKEVNLMDYINSILDGINISIGKYNSFRPFFDKDSDCIRLIDENYIQELQEHQNNEVIIINNFGKESIVTDYSFTSRITPNLAKLAIIAAQNGSQISEFSENALSFRSLTDQLTDRLSEIKKPAVKTTTEDELAAKLKQEEEILTNLKRLFKHFFDVYNYRDIIKKESIDELTNIWNDLLGKEENKIIIEEGKTPPRPIPIEYSLTIDGISGVLPYSIFRIPQDRLPKQYRPNLSQNFPGIDFTIFSINHSVENNKWYTTLRGQILYRQNKTQKEQ